MAIDGVKPGLSLAVPDFFNDEETTEALSAFADEFKADVRDNGLRKVLASAELAQPIQITLYVVGSTGLGILGNAGWAAIVGAYRWLEKRYPKSPTSIEIIAEDDQGHSADYLLADGSDEALRAIPTDLTRGVRGTRVQYDVDEGWLTWEEARAKKYGKRAQ